MLLTNVYVLYLLHLSMLYLVVFIWTIIVLLSILVVVSRIFVLLFVIFQCTCIFLLSLTLLLLFVLYNMFCIFVFVLSFLHNGARWCICILEFWMPGISVFNSSLVWFVISIEQYFSVLLHLMLVLLLVFLFVLQRLFKNCWKIKSKIFRMCFGIIEVNLVSWILYLYHVFV